MTDSRGRRPPRSGGQARPARPASGRGDPRRSDSQSRPVASAGTARTGSGTPRQGAQRPVRASSTDGADVRRRRPAGTAPELPDDVSADELPRDVRAELRRITGPTGDVVARHLVMAGRLLDVDPEGAYRHAVAARDRLPRVASVREAAGLCAYATGRWAEALAELRASRRISGSSDHLAVMADCERALGRPDRALALAGSAEAARLSGVAAAELRIVVAGARRDLGQLDAALLALQGGDLDASRRDPWSARLFYAYADILLAAGRVTDATRWFAAAAAADDDDQTDAADRLADLSPQGEAAGNQGDPGKDDLFVFILDEPAEPNT